MKTFSAWFVEPANGKLLWTVRVSYGPWIMSRSDVEYSDRNEVMEQMKNHLRYINKNEDQVKRSFGINGN